MSRGKYRSPSVFLNVPFDETYEPLFVTLVAGLVALGCRPRAAVELPDRGHGRLAKICGLIRTSTFSIHDLSCTRRSGLFRTPRFNMPFELGIAYALHLRSQRDFVVLESTSHRLEHSLNDLNGYDPLIHGDDPRQLLLCLLGIVERESVPSIELLDAFAAQCRRHMSRLKREQGITPYTQHYFHTLIALATSGARDLALID